MKTLNVILALLFAFLVQAQDREIKFRELTFDDALAAAEKENKPIFMDCYTVWCGPCKWMSANIFTQNEVADYYNENFICVKFDMEKGEGLDIAKEFSIRAYPTLIFVNSERQLVMKTIGASQEISHYIEIGDNARSDEYNMVALAENVADNRDNAAYMAKYFTIMAGADMASQEEVELYFQNIPEEQWKTEENFEIIMYVVEDIKSPVFQDLLENTAEYREVNGEMVDQFISYRIQDALMAKLYSRDPKAAEEYEALLEEISNWEFEGKEAVIFGVESARQKRRGPEAYMNYCADKVKEYLWEDADQLNNVAWYFFENTTDATYLAAAEEWAERAVKLNPAHHIMDTYANLLYANKKYEKALTIEQAALDQAKEEGADLSSYEEVIVKIKEAL